MRTIALNSDLMRMMFYGAFSDSLGRWLRRQELTLPRYILMLIQAYATSKQTTPQFLQAAMRCQLEQLDIYAEFIQRKAHEERGHEMLAEYDLLALGYNAEKAEESIKPSRSDQLTRLLINLVNDSHPISCLGYAFALEYFANFRNEQFFSRTEKIVPANVHANRCFSVHSSLGSDSHHIQELDRFSDSIPKALFSSVLVAVFDTATILATPNEDDFLDDNDIVQKLQSATA